MQVKVISAPVAARRSVLGSAARSLFLAVSREVAAHTHRTDDVHGYALPDAASVWIGMPVDRDVLLAAWMIDGSIGITAMELSTMSADQVREWAIGALMYVGTSAAKDEMNSPAFGARYASVTEDLAAYFELLCTRIDEAFSLATAPERAPAAAVPARRRMVPSYA